MCQIVKITWIDAQSFDLSSKLIRPDEIEDDFNGIRCSIVGFLMKENDNGYVIAKERWQSGECSYLHFIPKASVLEIAILVKEEKELICQKQNNVSQS